MDEDNIFDDGFDDLPVSEPDEIEQDPADFEEQVEEPTSEPTEPEQVEPETPQERMLRLKVDRGEKEVPESEAILLAQKGLNYERAVERAKQEARDSYIKEQGYTWNDKPISTEAEYKQALAEQEMMNQYKDRDVPPELLKRLMDLERNDAERQKEKQEKEVADKQQAAYNEFFEYFEEANERKFDPKTDVLPQDVLDDVNNGKSLLQSYMKHHNKQLRNSLKISKQNETNSKKAPVGSVTAHGNNKAEPDDEFILGFNSSD